MKKNIALLTLALSIIGLIGHYEQQSERIANIMTQQSYDVCLENSDIEYIAQSSLSDTAKNAVYELDMTLCGEQGINNGEVTYNQLIK